MSNTNTELLIRIRADLGRVLGDLNRVSTGVGGVGRSAQGATGSIHSMTLAMSSPSTRLTETLAATAKAAEASRTNIERTTAVTRAFAAEQGNVGGALASVFSKSAAASNAASAAVAGLKAQAVGLVAVYKLLEGAKAAVETTADLQDTETRLEALTGSSEKYAETEKYLVKLADDHHKAYFTLADSYTKLLAVQEAGIVTQKESRKILEGMSNAASKLGVSNADLALSMRGTVQQLGNSSVQWDEMRQATDPIPGLLQAIVTASGLTMEALKAQAATGEYTTAMFRDHLIKALDNYEGASARVGKNIHAEYTDIGNAYTALVKILEEPISDALTPVLQGIASGILYIANGPSLEAKIKQLEDTAKAIERYKAADEKIPVALQKQFNALQGDIDADAKAKELTANKEAAQDEVDQARRAADALKKELSDNEDAYYEIIIADEKKLADAKESAAKKAQSAAESAIKSAQSKAESAAKAYASEREAIAKNIEQLNFELAALKLSDNERAIQTKVRSLSAKATDEERASIEAKVRSLDKETAAMERQQAMWNQLVEDANAADKLRDDNAEFITRGDVQGGFNDRLAETRDQLDKGLISPEEAKIEFDKLGQAYNDYFIDPAKTGVSSLSEFSVQAAHNMQDTFADFLFEPFAKGTDGMAANFAKTFRRMVADAGSAQLFEAVLGKDFGKSNATGGLLSALFSGVAGAIGGSFGGESVSVASGNSTAFTESMKNFQWFPKKHSGGIVGHGGGRVFADPAIFSGATRYHNGGIAGLKPNERPIIALDEEEILRRSDPRHRYNLENKPTNPINDAGISITTQVNVSTGGNDADTGNKLGGLVNAAVKRVIVEEKRPGGLLAQGA